MLLYDTASNPYPWGGVFVRVNSPTDTAQIITDGFLNVQRGDIIRMTGRIAEFPDNSLSSTTQMVPLAGVSIDILSNDNPIPAPPQLPLSTFYKGLYPGGKIQFSTGEQYEGLYVEFNNVPVNSYVSAGNGTFSMVESDNMVSDLDVSKWYTLRAHRDPSSTYTLPALNTIIDTIRGYITTNSGGENPRGYRISPIFEPPPGPDLILGNRLAVLSNADRSPMVVASDSAPRISVKVTQGTFPLTAVTLNVSINWEAFSSTTMTYDSNDSLYKATIGAQPEGTFVRYFIEVTDNNANKVILASYGAGGDASDTSKGFFFYTVKNGPLTIYDIQYTPFANGTSPYAKNYPNGAVVSVSGIVTVDNTEMLSFPRSTVGGAYGQYMQNGNDPWNGIWITGPDSIIGGIQKGDSITVTGTVQEWSGFSTQYNTTKIGSISSVVIHSSGNPIPEPVLKNTADFGALVSNGSPLAEPYEGMLVKFQNATVTNIWPYFADNSQYEINDGSGAVWVHRDGTNLYSNIPAEAELGYNILYPGDFISEVTGIIHYSVSRYKFVPLSNSSFGNVGTPYTYNAKWNMLSLPRQTVGYTVATLYPGRTSSAFRFTPGSGYTPIADDAELAMGYGYWLKFGAAGTVYIPGLKLSQDSIPVLSGWNLIGTISSSVDAGTVTSEPPALIVSQFFGYNNGYFPASTLEPGKAYWVKASDSGAIVLSSAFSYARQGMKESELDHCNAIIITDNSGTSQTLYLGNEKEKLSVSRYEMPPLPPAGVFSARYASQRLVEVYPSQMKDEKQYPIHLLSVQYPLTLSLETAVQDPAVSISIKTSDGKSYPLPSGSTITIKEAKDNVLLLSVGKGNLPKEFSLSQNYPNPFNPTTNFFVAVPHTAQVEVVVYDILGRIVRTLVNGEMEAGYHTVEWNGLTDRSTQVGSGVYFVRMKAGAFTSVRKIMMMK